MSSWRSSGADPDGGVLLDHDEVLREEPALAPHVAGGLLYPDGFRTHPGALTAAAATAARAAGATVRTHVEVKRVTRGRVVTDEGTLEAETILLCAGAWTRTLARALGHDVQIRPVRGWLAVTAPSAPLIRHVIYEAGYAAPRGPQPGSPGIGRRSGRRRPGDAGAEPSHAFAAHQNADGTIMIGASRSAALRETDESADALRLNAAAALEWIPASGDPRGGDHLDRPSPVLPRRPAVHRLARGGRRGVRRTRQRGRSHRRRLGTADCADRLTGARAVCRPGAVSPRPMSSRPGAGPP